MRDYLDEHLPHRWIGRVVDCNIPLTQWPSRSPDLTLWDFFQWGAFFWDEVQKPRHVSLDVRNIVNIDNTFFSSINSGQRFVAWIHARVVPNTETVVSTHLIAMKSSQSFTGEKFRSKSMFVDLQKGRLPSTAVFRTTFACIILDQSLGPLTCPQQLLIGKRCKSAPSILRLDPNSIGSLKQKAVKTEVNYVAVPCIPYGGSINQPVTLTLGIPFGYVFLTTGRHSYHSKNVKSGKDPLTPAGLLKLVKRFEETGKLEDRARAGRPRLKEARAPCIAVEMEAIASEAASGTSSAR
ncbi:hypothetical protein TNCV_4747071 [Trichonephila clavipes]|nr:hypothetical protein TNCV_4747071 [Trichonephila clavipes]